MLDQTPKTLDKEHHSTQKHGNRVICNMKWATTHMAVDIKWLQLLRQVGSIEMHSFDQQQLISRDQAIHTYMPHTM